MTAALALMAGSASAASINFGESFEFEGSDDINLSLGSVAYAVNAGDAGDSQTVNVGATPVLFEAFADTTNMSIVSGTVNTASTAIGDLYATATDQAALDEVLNSHAFDDAAPYTLRLENLQIGQNYGLQVIGPADTREGILARVHTVESADGGTPGDISRNQDLDASGLGHVLSSFGTFTADDTFQDIIFAGPDNAGWGGLILTTVPEPASLTLFGLGIAAACVMGRRRWNR